MLVALENSYSMKFIFMTEVSEALTAGSFSMIIASAKILHGNGPKDQLLYASGL